MTRSPRLVVHLVDGNNAVGIGVEHHEDGMGDVGALGRALQQLVGRRVSHRGRQHGQGGNRVAVPPASKQ